MGCIENFLFKSWLRKNYRCICFCSLTCFLKYFSNYLSSKKTLNWFFKCFFYSFNILISKIKIKIILIHFQLENTYHCNLKIYNFFKFFFYHNQTLTNSTWEIESLLESWSIHCRSSQIGMTMVYTAWSMSRNLWCVLATEGNANGKLSFFFP
jgi:hypothetical protein